MAAQVKAQQKELGDVTILTAVSNMAFSAVWVAEHLKYFEQERVRNHARRRRRAHITTRWSPLGAPLGFEFRRTGASADRSARLIAIQAQNRNLTLSIAVRETITEKFKVTPNSPLTDRIKVLTELGTIGATTRGAVLDQILSFSCPK